MTTGLVISVTDELVAELEALASKATPGNWTTDGLACVVAKDSDQLNGGYALGFCEGPDELKNAEYMAKAGPLAIRALLAERAELLRDAGRYRWLRDEASRKQGMTPSVVINDGVMMFEFLEFDDCDTAIDAAMQSEAKQ